MEANSNKENLLLFILAFIQFTCVLDFMVMMPLSTILLKEFDITPTQFGLLVTSYSISGGIVSIISSFYLDRFDRKKVMLFAYVFFTLSTFACAMSTGFTSMLFSRILTGMFSGVLHALILSIVADVFPYKKRSTAMGKVMIGIGASAVLGVPLGNYLATNFFWQLPFYSIGFLAVVVIPFIYFLIPAMSEHIEQGLREKTWNKMKDILSSANRIKGLLLMTLLMMGSFSLIPFIPDYMVNNVGITQGDVSYIYLFGGLGSMAMLFFTGKLSDRYGNAVVYTALTIIAIVPIYWVTNLKSGGLIMVLLATSSLFIFGGSRNVPANTLIVSTALAHQRSGFMSLIAATQQIAAGIAAFIGSLLIDITPAEQGGSFFMVGWFAIITSILAIPIAFSLRAVDSTLVAGEEDNTTGLKSN